MPLRHLMLLLACLWPVAGAAEIFKCVASDGALTFAQTPCPEKDSKVTVQESAKSNVGDADECQYAHRFALATAQEMKAGTSSSTVFDRYGGLSALSRGSVSLISYVFQYRTNDDVSAERVAALSVAKCQAQSFGDVGCEQLPVAFTKRIGGCQEDDADGGPVPFASAAPSQGYGAPLESNVSEQAQYLEARALEERRRQECRDGIRAQIDKINSQMRSGYTSSQGNTLRDRRRVLENRLREC